MSRKKDFSDQVTEELRKQESQRTLDRAKAISKSRDALQRAQPAPALYIIIKWNGEAAGEPYYKKSEADGVCDKFYGPIARVVEYEPVENKNGKGKNQGTSRRR